MVGAREAPRQRGAVGAAAATARAADRRKSLRFIAGILVHGRTSAGASRDGPALDCRLASAARPRGCRGDRCPSAASEEAGGGGGRVGTRSRRKGRGAVTRGSAHANTCGSPPSRRFMPKPTAETGWLAPYQRANAVPPVAPGVPAPVGIERLGCRLRETRQMARATGRLRWSSPWGRPGTSGIGTNCRAASEASSSGVGACAQVSGLPRSAFV